MTAVDRPERPDPRDTDREAVARVLHPVPLTAEYAAADLILTTRDPAARTALIRSVIAGGAGDVLDALVEAGEVTQVVDADGNEWWVWKGQLDGSLAFPARQEGGPT